MMADGGLTDRQPCRDVLVPEALPDQRDHLALALREPGDFGSLGRRLGRWLWPGQLPEHAGNHRGFQPDLPARTCVIACRRVSTAFSLKTNPTAPCRIACRWTSGSRTPVKTRTRGFGAVRRSAGMLSTAVSPPLNPGPGR